MLRIDGLIRRSAPTFFRTLIQEPLNFEAEILILMHEIRESPASMCSIDLQNAM